MKEKRVCMMFKCTLTSWIFLEGYNFTVCQVLFLTETHVILSYSAETNSSFSTSADKEKPLTRLIQITLIIAECDNRDLSYLVRIHLMNIY